VSPGTGLTAPEQFVAYDPLNLTDTTPTQPGETTILKNTATGMYCQLRGMPTNQTQMAMYCDQPTPATATVMTYTGDGLAYQGVPLVSTGPGQPLLLANTTSSPVGPTAGSLTFPVASECWLDHSKHVSFNMHTLVCILMHGDGSVDGG
jgi:hypothetical protein